MEPWQRIDGAPEEDARTLLHQCCGAPAWVDAMLARRPFGSTVSLLEAARESWWSLSPSDWKAAFAGHPQIGDRASKGLPAKEQSGVRAASGDVLSALADANRAYHAKFGYIFIVCATGKSADEMLAVLRQRIGNDPEQEIRIAAAEQEKITAIRLESLREPDNFSAPADGARSP